MSNPKRAALIDLDGTLVDSAPDLAAAAVDWLVAIGRPRLSAHTITSFVGDGAAQLVRRCLVATGGTNGVDLTEATKAYLAAYAARNNQASHPYAGVRKALASLSEAGWGLAVVTNKPELPARKLLEDRSLESWFSIVIGGDTLPVRKPDPAPLLAACEGGGWSPSRAIMIGDGPQDQAAAKAAGIPSIHVTFGYGDSEKVRHGADDVASTWQEVLEALERLRPA